MPLKFVVKNANSVSVRNESKHLSALRGHSCIRQMIDTIESPFSLILEHCEDDLRSLSMRRKLQSGEIKNIARQLLEALSFVHSKNLVHTGNTIPPSRQKLPLTQCNLDIKPQNILLSGLGVDGTCHQSSVKLADFANGKLASSAMSQSMSC